MVKIVAQIAPQRSTQYTDLVTTLAPYEIALSTVSDYLAGAVTAVTLGGHPYLQLELNAELDDTLLGALGDLAMTERYFVYYEQIGTERDLLKPIPTLAERVLPESLVAARRYTGKTNELFTQFMLNVARASSDYRDTAWDKLTVLDPLAGGGTTLFVGLMLGADVAGVEHSKKVNEGTIAFIKQYMKEARITAQYREDRMKHIGKRWFITLEKRVRCVVGYGDTNNVAHFVNGLKRPQLVVTDLPYGIQHGDEWQTMLAEALPAWAEVMADGGALVFSWNATRLPRQTMIDLVQENSDFRVITAPPYDQLAHQVDRVIKVRDVIVARR